MFQEGVDQARDGAGKKGVALMTYRVFVDDNYHYMDKDKRYTHGEFKTLEAAVEAAKRIVDDGLLNDYEPGMSASNLYSRYKMFGDDPWVSGPEDSHFSAWTYAQARCEIICAGTDPKNV
jgi:hypothetical protein